MAKRSATTPKTWTMPADKNARAIRRDLEKLAEQHEEQSMFHAREAQRIRRQLGKQ